MGLTNFILECEKDNEQLRNDINYYKNFNKRLQKENKELKKQLEEYEKQLKPNYYVKGLEGTLKEYQHTMTKYDTQQKEFIEYMTKTIEELECDDVDDEEMKGYLIQKIDIFKEILSKYKEIIGGKE